MTSWIFRWVDGLDIPRWSRRSGLRYDDLRRAWLKPTERTYHVHPKIEIRSMVQKSGENQLIWRIDPINLKGFIYLRWCRISSINSQYERIFQTMNRWFLGFPGYVPQGCVGVFFGNLSGMHGFFWKKCMGWGRNSVSRSQILYL